MRIERQLVVLENIDWAFYSDLGPIFRTTLKFSDGREIHLRQESDLPERIKALDGLIGLTWFEVLRELLMREI